MPDSASFPEKWTPQPERPNRFRISDVRHGMEQYSSYRSERRGAALMRGSGRAIAFPAGLLIILGLFTRPISLVLAVLYFVLYFVGPLQRGWFTHRNGGDPILLNAFFFLYLAAAGAGAWGLDKRERDDVSRTHQALGLLRIVAGCLFMMHGLEKFFSVGGGRIDRDIMTMRGLAGWLEFVGGPLLVLGLLTRPVAFLLSVEMAVAYFRSWAPRGFWQSFQLPGMEASILFCYLFLMFWAAGPGAWSLDGLWRRRRDHKRGGSTMKAQRTALATSAALLVSGAAQAQWVNRPTPGIPRLPNGKPNLNAPAPPRLPDGHPDLSGIWDVGAMTYFHDLAAGLKGDDAPQLTRGRRASLADATAATWTIRTLHASASPPEPQPFKIIQTRHDDRPRAFVGARSGNLHDGRPLPKFRARQSLPGWATRSAAGKAMSSSSSIGFRDRGWLSANMAYPNSDALHVIERWRRGLRSPRAVTIDHQGLLKLWTNSHPDAAGRHRDPRFYSRQPDDHAAHYSMGLRPPNRRANTGKVGV